MKITQLLVIAMATMGGVTLSSAVTFTDDITSSVNNPLCDTTRSVATDDMQLAIEGWYRTATSVNAGAGAGANHNTGGAYGIFQNAPATYDGEWIYQVVNYQISQDQVFQFSWWGNIAGSGGEEKAVLFWADGLASNGTITAADIVANAISLEQTATLTSTWKQTSVESTLALTPTTAEGKYIGIAFIGQGGNTARFDDFTLKTAIIPEPSAYALAGGALALGVVLVVRRRKHN